MMRSSFLLGSALIVALTTTSAATVASAQEPPIPDIHGVWLLTGMGKTTEWDASQSAGSLKERVDICLCGGPYFDDLPNFILVPHSDPDDFFLGFVRDRTLALYKDDSEPGNVGLETLIGTVKKNKKRLKLDYVGFDSNYAWGGVWSGFVLARKTSDLTTHCWRCP